MTFITSLVDLRKHAPCESDFRLLLINLNKTIHDNEPLSLNTIVSFCDLNLSLWCLRACQLDENDKRSLKYFNLDMINSISHLFTTLQFETFVKLRADPTTIIQPASQYYYNAIDIQAAKEIACTNALMCWKTSWHANTPHMLSNYTLGVMGACLAASCDANPDPNTYYDTLTDYKNVFREYL